MTVEEAIASHVRAVVYRRLEVLEVQCAIALELTAPDRVSSIVIVVHPDPTIPDAVACWIE